VTVLTGMTLTRERISYSVEKKNPLMGFKDIIKNKHARVVIFSEFLKSFRGLATYMEGFLAIAIIGDPSKKIFILLPIGIGTAVGMLVINFLLKKFNAKVLYISSGIYSMCANIVAFTIGYFYFKIWQMK
jgi:Na+/melibiose symporter-like transporter